MNSRQTQHDDPHGAPADERLLRWLRSAADVEAFDGASTEGSAHVIRRPTAHAGRTRSPSSHAIARRWVAAAAVFLLGGLAVSAYVYTQANSGRTAGTSGAPLAVNTTGTASGSGIDPDLHAESTVLMAIVEDAPGHVRCVRWTGVTFGGRSLSDLTPEELRTIGMGMLCAEDSQRALVVGMQGPRSALPSSDDHAAALARCLVKTASCGVGVFDAARCAQAGCAGERVRMRVESLALR